MSAVTSIGEHVKLLDLENSSNFAQPHIATKDEIMSWGVGDIDLPEVEEHDIELWEALPQNTWEFLPNGANWNMTQANMVVRLVDLLNEYGELAFGYVAFSTQGKYIGAFKRR